MNDSSDQVHPAPLPHAGGARGWQRTGTFKPRNTARARGLRNAAPPAERTLWTVLSGRRLNGHKFSRQMPIGPYFADFLCRDAKLVVELDGPSHDLRVEQDAARDAYMAQQGYAVLRFSNDDVMANVEGVAQAIAKALASRCPPPTPPASGRGEETQKLLGISLEGNVGS